MRTVVVLRQDGMGQGDAELGRRILGTFLRKARTLKGLEAIVFYNSGVRLLAADCPLIPEFAQLEEHGVDLLACGTCLEHFALEPRVGDVSNMDEILRELDAAERVITL